MKTFDYILLFTKSPRSPNKNFTLLAGNFNTNNAVFTAYN
jgi:hypothetical protein